MAPQKIAQELLNASFVDPREKELESAQNSSKQRVHDLAVSTLEDAKQSQKPQNLSWGVLSACLAKERHLNEKVSDLTTTAKMHLNRVNDLRDLLDALPSVDDKKKTYEITEEMRKLCSGLEKHKLKVDLPDKVMTKEQLLKFKSKLQTLIDSSRTEAHIITSTDLQKHLQHQQMIYNATKGILDSHDRLYKNILSRCSARG